MQKRVWRKTPRNLTPAQKVLIAKELYKGRNFKQVAQDWHVSESQVRKVFHLYLSYTIIWKVSCRNFEVCVYPLCKCGIDLPEKGE